MKRLYYINIYQYTIYKNVLLYVSQRGNAREDFHTYGFLAQSERGTKRHRLRCFTRMKIYLMEMSMFLLQDSNGFPTKSPGSSMARWCELTMEAAHLFLTSPPRLWWTCGSLDQRPTLEARTSTTIVTRWPASMIHGCAMNQIGQILQSVCQIKSGTFSMSSGSDVRTGSGSTSGMERAPILASDLEVVLPMMIVIWMATILVMASPWRVPGRAKAHAQLPADELPSCRSDIFA